MPASSLMRRIWPGTVLISLMLGGCTQLALLTANTRAALGDYHKHANLRYGQGQREVLDVYLPKDKAGQALKPVVIFIHGGGWNSGDKHQYQFVGATLAEQGFVAMLPDYSLYPQAKFPVFMHDAAQAIVWAHAHATEYGGDPQRIYLMGHSAGAHIAALVALDTHYLSEAGGDAKWIAGVVGLAGPYDFIPFTYKYMYDLFGAPSEYGLSQPVNYVRPDAPPMLLLHGANDRTVDPRNASSLGNALHKVGAKAQVVYYPKVNHGDLVAAFSPLARSRAPVVAAVTAFINGDTGRSTDRPDGRRRVSGGALTRIF